MRISDWSSDVCSSDLPSVANSLDPPHDANNCSARRFGATGLACHALLVNLDQPGRSARRTGNHPFALHHVFDKLRDAALVYLLAANAGEILAVEPLPHSPIGEHLVTPNAAGRFFVTFPLLDPPRTA